MNPAAEDRRLPEWDLRNGFSNLAALVGAQGASTAASLLSIWLVTQSLGAAGYGGLAAAIISTQLAGFLFVEWTGVSLWRFGCEEFVATGRVANTFWTRFLLVAVSLVILLGVSPWLLPAAGAMLGLPANLQPVLLGYITVTVSWNHLQRTLQAVKLPRIQGSLLAAERIISLVIISSLWMGNALTLERALVSYTCSPLIPMAVAVYRLRRLIAPPFVFERARLRNMLAFSLPLIPHSLAASVSAIQLDAFFITRYLPLQALGVYSLGNQMASTVMLLPQHAGSLLLSFFVTSQTAQREQFIGPYLREVLPPLALIWSVSCVLCAWAGGYLVRLLFGPEFEQAAELLWPLMAASAMVGPVALGYGPLSNARSATYMSTAAFGTSAVTNIALNIAFIPTFGLMGCAWASVCASISNTLVWFYFAKQLRAPLTVGTARALAPALVGAGWATGTGHTDQAMLIAVGLAVLIGWRDLRDISGRVRRITAAGVSVPPWLMNLLPRAS